MKQLMFSLLLIVLAVGLTNAQTTGSATTWAPIGATVLDGFTLDPGEFGLEELNRGYTYQVYLDAVEGAWKFVSLTDPTAPADPAAWTEFILGGLTPGSSITISMILPTALIGEFGALPVSFPKAWFVPGADYANALPFNPNAPYTVNVGFGGADALFAPEMLLTVPASVPGTEFFGVIVASVSYTGL